LIAMVLNGWREKEEYIPPKLKVKAK
jgi:hypothetical protein